VSWAPNPPAMAWCITDCTWLQSTSGSISDHPGWGCNTWIYKHNMRRFRLILKYKKKLTNFLCAGSNNAGILIVDIGSQCAGSDVQRQDVIAAAVRHLLVPTRRNNWRGYVKERMQRHLRSMNKQQSSSRLDKTFKDQGGRLILN
jgi:hypothetical protein